MASTSQVLNQRGAGILLLTRGLPFYVELAGVDGAVLFQL